MPFSSLFQSIYELIRDATGDEAAAKAAAEAARREWEAAGHGKIDVSPIEDALKDATGDYPEGG